MFNEMSGITVNIDNVMMNTINDYLADKKYKDVKPFYDGVSTSHIEGAYTLSQQSLKLLLNLLSSEIIVELYMKLAPVPKEIEAKEAANKAAAEEAAKEAARGKLTAEPENNIAVLPETSPVIEEVKE